MAIYNLSLSGDTLTVGFNPSQPASNDQLCAFVRLELMSIDFPGGKLIKINGAASLPIALVLGHKLQALYGAIGVYDPKLQKYVIAISNSKDFHVGDLVE